MYTNAATHYPTSTAEAKRPCSRCGQCSLAQCILCCARAVLFVGRPCATWSILSQGEPPTGEPDAGEPPVRFGGRGSIVSPYPYYISRLRRDEPVNSFVTKTGEAQPRKGKAFPHIRQSRSR